MKRIAWVVACLLAICGCHHAPSDVPINEKPVESAPATLPISAESTIAVNATIPHSTLATWLTRGLPTSVLISGRQHVCVDVYEAEQRTIEEKIGGDVGKLVGAVVSTITRVVTINVLHTLCGDVDHHEEIKVDGPATVSPIAGGVRIAVPLSVTGQAGFAGDLSKAIALNKKNFRGAITAFVDLSFDLDTTWCPVVHATPDFVWRDKAQLEVASKFWIDVDSAAGDKILDAMTQAAQQIQSKLSCDDVRKVVEPAWKTYDVSLGYQQGVPAWVRIEPKAVGFSGLNYTDTGIDVALAFTASADVRSGPLPTGPAAPPSPLPDLTRIPAQGNVLSLDIPIRTRYADITALAQKAIGNKTFSADSPAEPVSVTTKAISVYPSKDRLVIGVAFDAVVKQAKPFNVSGTVYLLGTPDIDAKTQVLSIKNIAFSRVLNNELWNLLSVVFRDQIVTTLSRKAVFPLEPVITPARESAKRALAAQGMAQGINITLKDDLAGIKAIRLTREGVETIVSLEGQVNVVLLDKSFASTK